MAQKRRTYLDRMKALPGNQQAFMLSARTALRVATGEDGKIDENKRMQIMFTLGKKVAELWELPPMMEQYLVQRWVENNPAENPELEMFFTGEKQNNLSHIKNELASLEAKLINVGQIRKDHLYLDVTGLSYGDLRKTYTAVSECRKMLGIELKEVRKGAPESIDYTRALIAARGEERGMTRKELAEILEFPIYTQDIRSGVYPQLQKYLKIGRDILEKINKLEEYIEEVTGIDRNTL